MKIKSARIPAVLLAMLFAAPMVTAQAPPPQPAAAPDFTAEDEAIARIQLGERFCDLGLRFAAGTRASRAALQESAALIEGATRMNPQEPRFFRLLAIVRERAGDMNGAIDAWRNYLVLNREDEVAQITLIDLYLSQMQSNDVKLRYLNSILAKPAFAVRVKAHVAVRAVPLLDQRSHAEALAMLATARGYCPLPEVTLLEWQMLSADATRPQQLAALLNVLRANPMHGEALSKVSDMLAGVGLSEEALSWYAILLDVNRAQDIPTSLSTSLNYLTERYRAGEATFAGDQLDKHLQAFPEDTYCWFLRLTIARGDESAQMLRQAQQVFARRVNTVCTAAVTGALPEPQLRPATTPATSQPATSTPATNPAVAADLPLDAALTKAIARLKQLDDPQLRNLLIESVADLVWFELYFDHNAPAAAPSLAALRQLLPSDNILLRRLVGWFGLVTGDEAGLREARTLFTAQQDVDPLSALGLLRLEDRDNHSNEAAAIGAKIASNPHAGVVGAVLWEAIKGRGFKGNPQPDAVAIKAELDKFPKDWLQVIHNPSRFYALRAEPITVGHRLGEPMLATVTIENNCKLDLTIGDYGLIKPTIVFDARIRGTNERAFPGITQDRLMGRQVLSVGESLTQVVRIDQGELGDVMRSNPSIMLLLNAYSITNPREVGPSIFQASAGGYARNFNKMFTRTPAPLVNDADRRALFAKMEKASPGDKMLDLDLLAAYVNKYVQPGATKEEKDLAQQFANVIDKYRADAAPGVKLWASYTFVTLLTGNEEQKAIGEMLEGKSWDRRMLALAAARRFLPPDITRQIAIRQAATDPDKLVKAHAAAIVELLQSPSTQPAPIQPAAIDPGR